jgi:hypothetical protein
MGLLTRYIFFVCLFFFFESYSLVIFGAPSLTRGRVCNAVKLVEALWSREYPLYLLGTEPRPHIQYCVAMLTSIPVL